MAIVVEQPGVHTTVQDLGRAGYRAIGVPVGGAVDRLALRVANLLVGNSEDEAGLEFVGQGPTLRFEADRRVAVCGARAEGVPGWEAFEVRKGGTLSLARLGRFTFGYLAVAGGFDVPSVLGSRSTDVRVGWGGVEGRTLRRGDPIELRAAGGRGGSRGGGGGGGGGRVHFEPWYAVDAPIRIVRGGEWEFFDAAWTRGEFSITAQRDRMGLRLRGAALKCRREGEMASCPVVPGTIQVPPGGEPIVLLADSQTLGGYPRIAHVVSIDLHRIAQLQTGTKVRFEEVSLETAHDLARHRDAEIARLRVGLAG